MSKNIFIDTETTGLDASKCAIFQLAGIIEIDGKIKDRFNLQMKPFEGAILSPDALKVTKMTEAVLNTYPSQTLKYQEFIQILNKHVDKYNKLDKFTIVGFYVHFDTEYLRRFFERNNDKFYGSYFWSNSIDISTIAGLALMNERSSLANFKLTTVAKYLGIEHNVEDVHDASVDIQLTYDLFHKFVD